MCKDVKGMKSGKAIKSKYQVKPCRWEVRYLNPALFSKIFFKKTLPKVFIDIRKSHGNVLTGKNFCLDQFSNRKGKNKYKNNQEEIKEQDIFSKKIGSERYRIRIFFP